MTASLEGIQRILQQIRAELPLLVQSSQIAPQQIVIGEGLSDIDRRMGLLQAGEFRTGNGVEPGLGFSGVRIGYPAFLYSSALWHIVGVNDDVMQFGLRASDGVAVAGGGVVTLDEDGVAITAPTSATDLNSYKFVFGSTVIGALYGFRSDADNFQLTLQSVNLSGDFGSIYIISQGASQGSVSLQATKAGGVTSGITLIGTTSSGLIKLNPSSANVDTQISGDTDANLLYTDASTDRVGIGTATPDKKLHVNGTAKVTSLVWDGWVEDTNTWSYSSADDPTFIISVNADMTALIGVGDRIKLTQTTAKYFIVTAVGSFSGGATLITVYGGTDYDLANAAITSPYYSHVKEPFGFPATPAKWTVSLTDTTQRTQATPTQNTWYNMGSLSLDIPIGVWRVSYKVFPDVQRAAAGTVNQFVTLSTANNTESDADFTTGVGIANTTEAGASAYVEKLLTLASKTTYYVNSRTTQASMTNIILLNSLSKFILNCVCAYL